LGSKTREKRSTEKYTVLRQSGLDDLRKLVLSYTAGDIDDNLAQLYRNIAHTRTGLSLETLAELLPRTIGGTPAHRYDSMRSGPVMAPVGNPREGGWMAISTDHIENVSASPEDWPLPLQTHISFLVSLCRVAAAQGSVRREYWLQVKVDGLDRIVDGSRSLPDHPSPTLPRSLVGNPLCWVDSLEFRSASTVVGGTAETPPHQPGLVLGRRLAAGLMLDALLSPRTKDLSSDVGGAAHIEVDVLACSNLGGQNLYRAAQVASAGAVIWHLVTRVGSVDRRFVVERLIDNVCSGLIPFLWEALNHHSMDLGPLREEGIWTPGGGSGGVKSLKGTLLAHLRNATRVSLYSWKDFREEMVLPERSSGHPAFFSLLWPMAQAIWEEHTTQGVHLGPLKLAMSAILKTVRASGTPTDIVGLGVHQAMYRLKRIAAVLGGEGHVYRPTVRTMKGDSVELWRLLRRVPRDPPSLPEDGACPLTGGDLGKVEYSLVGPKGVPLRLVLEENPPCAVAEKFRWDDRGRRSGLRGTTVANVWYPLIGRLYQKKPRTTSTLVVGTGRGGIQHLLERMGYRSIGLDLATSIPPEVMASPSWLPPDCSGLGTYSPLMRSTSGDWMDETVSGRALALHHPDMVIIDIESGSQRWALELLAPLYSHGHKGGVLIRLFLTIEELQTLLAILTASAATKITAVVPATEDVGLEEEEGTVPYLIGLVLRRGARIATVGQQVEVTTIDGGTFSIPNSSEARREARKEVISRMTGGHISVHNPALAVQIGRAAAAEATGGRGSTKGGSLLSILRGCQAIQMVLLARVKKFMHYRTCISYWGDLPGFDFGHVRVPKNDPTMWYIYKKLMPRLWASLEPLESYADTDDE